MSGSGLTFFLSYARDDRRSGPPVGIAQFFEDLSRVLRPRLSNVVEGDIGFLDTRGIEPGSAWPESLRQALGSVQAFVPVLSPRYFERQYCGKEWAAFASRMPPGARLIQPVLFVPPVDLNPMPMVMREIHYAHEKYPREYLDRGLSELLNVPTHRDTYMKFVYAFADVLVTALRESPPTPAREIPLLAEIDSPFHDRETGYRTADPAAPPGRRLFAQFIYVAARRDELQGMRSELEAYGDTGGLDWQPYLPDLDTEIGIIAGEVASRERFFYESAELDGRLVERIQEAIAMNKVVVVVVDPWTVRLARYQTLMRDLDQMASTSCAVLIPVNENDAETAQWRGDLENVVEATFINRTAAPDPAAFAPWIRTPKALEEEMAAKLAGAKMRVLRRDEVVRRARGRNLMSSPPSIGTSPARQ